MSFTILSHTLHTLQRLPFDGSWVWASDTRFAHQFATLEEAREVARKLEEPTRSKVAAIFDEDKQERLALVEVEEYDGPRCLFCGQAIVADADEDWGDYCSSQCAVQAEADNG